MPMETAEQLSRTLAEAFSKAAQPTDTRPQIIKLTDPPRCAAQSQSQLRSLLPGSSTSPIYIRPNQDQNYNDDQNYAERPTRVVAPAT